MLSTLPLLTALQIAVLYPLTFLISTDDPIKNNYHRFHLGFPLFLAGVLLVILNNIGLWPPVFHLYGVWVLILTCVTAFYWKSSHPNPYVLLCVSILGITCYAQIQFSLWPQSQSFIFTNILSGAILTMSLYAMNLGHFYLNVHGLSIHHLLRSTYIFGTLLGIRLIYDSYQFITQDIIWRGDTLNYFQFAGTLDGFFIIIALLFGTILPLLCLYLVRGTLLVKSTQSATGILYAILCSVIIGDMTYKYYMWKYSMAL